LLAWSGIEVLDYENYTVNVRGEDFRTLMEAYKTIYSHSILTPPQDLDWRDSFAEKLLLDQQILFSFIFNPSFLRTYATVSTDATPVWFPFPTVTNEVVGTPAHRAGIRNNSRNIENAYEFLKVLLDEQFQHHVIARAFDMWSFPVNRVALRTSFEELVLNTYNTGTWSSYAQVAMTTVPDTVVNSLIIMADNAIALQYPSARIINRIVNEEMTPFFRGERSYEDCLDLLENKLLVYVGE
jgi:hypothetical protein